MGPKTSPTPQEMLEEIKKALSTGQKQRARRLAWQAVQADPEQEEPWLYLASLSDPQASIIYLRKALDINPSSEAARKGMRWAADRLREQEQQQAPPRNPLFLSLTESELVKKESAVLPWFATVLILCLVVLVWLWTPDFSFALPSLQVTPGATSLPQESLIKATFTYTPSPTPTNTPTPTPTNTPTPTPTPRPTKTRKPTQVNRNTNRPPQVKGNERWIEINLTKQRLYAYQGSRLVNSFVVSTGTWVTPTVTGTYQIYVKHRYAHMAGPGYYLPNVPFTMYFYKGYGIHGTYWHNNFGTPMSHGCVNMRTSEAGWIFSWASVGTSVYIHY